MVWRRRGPNAGFPGRGREKKFHRAYQRACDSPHDADYYPKFKKWCDEYFFLPHRNEARGVGGIFYDNVNTGDWEADFAFTQDVGRAFLEIYPLLARTKMNIPWTDEQRQAQRVSAALCGVQSSLRPGHVVRAEDRGKYRSDPDVAAARYGVALTDGFIATNST